MRAIYKIAVPVSMIFFLAAGCGSSNTSTYTNNTPPANQQTANQPPTTIRPATGGSPSQPGQQHAVTYTDSGFSPKTITIKKGDSVVFKNSASDSVRVASNPHPIHNGYPTTGGCISSTFDSCGNIGPGQSWSFTFDIAGSWGYHNHLNPSEGGTVVVQ